MERDMAEANWCSTMVTSMMESGGAMLYVLYSIFSSPPPLPFLLVFMYKYSSMELGPTSLLTDNAMKGSGTTA